MSESSVRVASVPADHVYVMHLAGADNPDGADGVQRLLDPPVAGRASASQWWPPVMLEPGWVADHANEFDVFHLHFGFDARTPAQLAELVDELQAAGKPLVYTVHDLRNPHQADPAPHSGHLDVLIPAAAAVVTLTPGAAQQIERRWGRQAVVLPHPHVVDFPRMSQTRHPSTGRFIVGVHAKSLRASMDPLAVIRVLVQTLRGLPGSELRVDIHTDVIDPHGYNHDPEVARFLRAASAAGELSLQVHDYFSDEQLWSYLRGLDLSVLPYRFGTHSGWLEACHDLGTTVVAPTCGFYAEQRPCLTYGHDESGLDDASLAQAVTQAYEQRPVWQAQVADRRRERQALAAAHRQLYLDVLAEHSNVLMLQ